MIKMVITKIQEGEDYSTNNKYHFLPNYINGLNFAQRYFKKKFKKKKMKSKFDK